MGYRSASDAMHNIFCHSSVADGLNYRSRLRKGLRPQRGLGSLLDVHVYRSASDAMTICLVTVLSWTGSITGPGSAKDSAHKEAWGHCWTYIFTDVRATQ